MTAVGMTAPRLPDTALCAQPGRYDHTARLGNLIWYPGTSASAITSDDQPTL